MDPPAASNFSRTHYKPKRRKQISKTNFCLKSNDSESESPTNTVHCLPEKSKVLQREEKPVKTKCASVQTSEELNNLIPKSYGPSDVVLNQGQLNHLLVPENSGNKLHKSKSCPKKNSASQCNTFMYIGRNQSSESSSSGNSDDLTVTVISARLNDFGVTLLGKKYLEWTFLLEVKAPVEKNLGHAVWNKDGRRLPTDLQSVQFISCLYRDGEISFNQTKVFKNVNKDQALLFKLEAKGFASLQRRLLGCCRLPLKDLCDARVIIPLSTVQPNAQLSLEVSYVDIFEENRGEDTGARKKTGEEGKGPSPVKRVTFTPLPSALDTQLSDQLPKNPVSTDLTESGTETSNDDEQCKNESRREGGNKINNESLKNEIEKVSVERDSGQTSEQKSSELSSSPTWWTIFIERANNLPPGVSCTYVSCNLEMAEELVTDVSEDNSWDWSKDLLLCAFNKENINFKLWQKISSSGNREDKLIGEVTVELNALRYLSCLSGWYNIQNQGSDIGQIKISIWPKSEKTKVEKPRQSSKKGWNDWKEQLVSLEKALDTLKPARSQQKLPVNEFLKRSVEKQRKQYVT